MPKPALKLTEKRVGIVLAIAALTGLLFAAHGFAQQRPAPFGLHPGVTLDQIKTAVGEKRLSVSE